MLKLSFQALAAAACGGCFASASCAQSGTDTALPDVHAVEQSETRGYLGRRASNTMKSDAALNETPRSVTVLTRELLDAQQVTTVSEALRNVPGVVAGTYGRRGWDDYLIRGQDARASILVDGLPVGHYWLAQEPFGYERIDVLKGSASGLYGAIQAGGAVNMVSKRPRAETFAELGVTYGSNHFKQLTLDTGRPLDGKAAWRLNALLLDRGDPTRFVYEKHYWIAPSLTLDLGAHTDFTLLFSHNQRDYLRQQGISPYGSVLPNRNGHMADDFFSGEPGLQQPYSGNQSRLGYELEHRFHPDWKLIQHFRVQHTDVAGTGIFLDKLGSDKRTQERSGRKQNFDMFIATLDTALAHTFEAGGKHSTRFGVQLDYRRDANIYRDCTVKPIDLFKPVYGKPIVCNDKLREAKTVYTSAAGFYLLDEYRINERLLISGALRHDQVSMRTTDQLKDDPEVQRDQATSGSVGLSYAAGKGWTPYISYATSFSPNSGMTSGGQMLQPETGKQYEAGIKWLSTDQRSSVNLAWYQLTRNNVGAKDPLAPGYKKQVGEQRSHGIELELAAELRKNWHLKAGYANTIATIVNDVNRSNIGKSLDDVPRHSASLWTSYRMHGGALNGLELAGGARFESAKRGSSYSYVVPAYTVFDAAVTYVAGAYKMALNIKNLTDKRYYPGGINDSALPTGDPRTLMLNLTRYF
ncbi:TonB-dependent siderophore receptor [Herbaspirillum autotrophicum]|uniref:TonB-dependent siderophore receptor n=1 Tax=Herbaspirillum autotrophicum TaxID=180195 RepID=UPI00067B4887|nr:TonB-dependent siderophore receptor [Herbaspirillum autotrophicum]